MKKISNKKKREQPKDKNKETPVVRCALLNNAMTKPMNDGTNTPVPDITEPHIPSASEAALYKQAENPLGNPDKK